GSRVEKGAKGQRLTAEDHLLILMQAGNCLAVARGLAAAEARLCYERAEALWYSLNRPLALYAALMGQWRCSPHTDTLPATVQIAQRVYALAHEQQNSALMIGACAALGITHFFLGDFEDAQRYLEQGLELWLAFGRRIVLRRRRRRAHHQLSVL